MEKVYLDNAATTRVRDEVISAMLPYFAENYGNMSSIHSFGRDAYAGVKAARDTVAGALRCDPSEIFFTSGGTEADNWAIFGAAYANTHKGKHVITSCIEHHAVLHAFEQLEKDGFRVTYLPVDEYGRVNPDDLRDAVTDDTILVSVMYANNEIGTIQPIGELAAICAERGIIFHTDAVQAFCQTPIDVSAEHIALLSVSGHKLHGPKGVGALYIRKGIKISRFMHGGAQERNRRAGTENVPGIVGFGKAVELAQANMNEHIAHMNRLRDKLINGIMDVIPDTRLNGHPTRRLPGNVNVCFRFIEGEGLLLNLDLKGIAASSGSACTSGSLDPSHVLLAIGLPHEIAHGSLRLTLSDFNTEEEVDYVLRELPPIVQKLRDMSPLFMAKEGGISYV